MKNKLHSPYETTDIRGGFHHAIEPPKTPKVVICSRGSGKQFLLNKILEESKEKVIIVRKEHLQND